MINSLKNNEINKINEKKIIIPKDINRKIDDDSIKRLYCSFIQYEYIDDDIKEEDFVQKFLREPIVLNLSVPAFRMFYNLCIDKYKDISIIKPKEFVKLFINKSTKKVYDTRQFSKSQNPSSKKEGELIEIFKNL